MRRWSTEHTFTKIQIHNCKYANVYIYRITLGGIHLHKYCHYHVITISFLQHHLPPSVVTSSLTSLDSLNTLGISLITFLDTFLASVSTRGVSVLEMPSHLKINQAGGKVSATAGLLAPNIEKSLPTSFCQKKTFPREERKGGGWERKDWRQEKWVQKHVFIRLVFFFQHFTILCPSLVYVW